MEVVEDPLVKTPVVAVDTALTCSEDYKNSAASAETDKCHRSNGDAKSEDAEHSEITLSEEVNTDNVISDIENLVSDKGEKKTIPEDKVTLLAPPSDTQENLAQCEIVETCPNTQVMVTTEEKSDEDLAVDGQKSKSNNRDMGSSNEKNNLILEKVIDIVEPIIPAKDLLNSTTDKVTFETEILVESNDNELLENKIKHEPNPTPNILTELGQSIELSEALRASDVTDNTKENNNCTIASQEMFNKEELLDILEGNDENEEEIIAIITNDTTKQTTIIHSTNPKKREAEIAMDQLTRLKSRSKTPRTRRMSKKQKEDIIEKVIIPEGKIISEKPVIDGIANAQQVIVGEEVTVAEEVIVVEEVKAVDVTKEESIVSDLVKDWDEDDQLENVPTNQTGQNSMQDKIDDEIILQEEIKQECDSQESTPSDQGVTTKSRDEGVPQRRLGRVIKKKVIFDPDNPDTFTKTKVTKPKDNQIEKEQPPLKKTKLEHSNQIQQRSKSKSPISKLQWKKPTTKHNNRIKRPSEIDKLLMDEGALNMIYQLTPEAPKGKKNMKTKAEFIKKIQSSTPDSKEMKFRERKKEAKYEEGEAKKILGGKQRISLSSSVKSPSVSEDFEAHSADDSIIYRRHSSSSYSSSCMSPRRLSDVEGTVGPTNSRPSLGGDNLSETQQMNTTEVDSEGSAAFMGSNSIDGESSDVINKHDCLSIKKKLNTKLALALNKRKRESGKVDKSAKSKKMIKSDSKAPNADEEIKVYKHLSINLTDRLGEIIIRKSGSKYNLEVISELIRALQFLESIEDISVILLTSECGTLCAGLELNLLLDENNEVKAKYAQELAESVRSLFCLLEQHSKLVCTGIEGTCWGISLAMVALSDVCVASERAIFQLGSWGSQTESKMTSIVPGLAVFTANLRPWPRSLLNDLMIFGRQLSAAEALQCGLVSRNIWPERFLEQLHGISKDIASLPVQNVLLKKKLLKINNGSQSTFLSCLEKERDLFVKYWLSAEGQESLRAHIGNS